MLVAESGLVGGVAKVVHGLFGAGTGARCQGAGEVAEVGILIQLGERGGAEYRVGSSVSVPARIRHTDAELDQVALELAAQAPLTNAILRKETGLDAAQARKVLKRLVDRGDVVQRGSRRGTRYELEK